MSVNHFKPHPPNEDGKTNCVIRWLMETPSGWVGSWDKAALEQFVEPSDEAVLYQHKKPLINESGEILGYSEWINGRAGLSWWPERSLYIQPQPEPELLKALKALVSSAERVSVGEYDEETLDINLSQARAAIVKATGRRNT